MNYLQAKSLLESVGQAHLLRYYDELKEEERQELLRQIEETDWSVIDNFYHPEDLSGKGEIVPIEGLSLEEIDRRKEEFTAVGQDMLRRGKVILEEKGKISLSPNGNGGWFSSLLRSGLMEDVRRRGVEWFNVFAVDNVCQRIADPAFVGATVLSGCDCGAKAVSKAEPHERVGALCLENGHPSIIEYYELTEEMAQARNADGTLKYRYGVILNYLFALSRLEEIASEKIPVHVVRKKVPYLDESGALRKPETENGCKFETLVLDMIKLMQRCLPYEVRREYEFAPIKNKTGVDSVESARELLKKNGVEL